MRIVKQINTNQISIQLTKETKIFNCYTLSLLRNNSIVSDRYCNLRGAQLEWRHMHNSHDPLLHRLAHIGLPIDRVH